MKTLFRRSKLPVTTPLDPFRGSGLSTSWMSRCAFAILAGFLGWLQLGCIGRPSTRVGSQLSTAAAAEAPVQPEVPRLVLGVILERDLGRGQIDEIGVVLGAKQYVRLVIDQKQMDVAASLLGPTGQVIVASDGPGGRRVREVLSAVISERGEYRLVVTPHDPQAEAGRYRVTLEELRPGLPDDGDRVKAETALSEAAHWEVAGQGMDLSRAFEKAQESLSLWRRIGDLAGEARTLIVLASLHYRSNDPASMAAALNDALSRSLAARDERGEAEALWMLASFTQLDQGMCIRYLDRALEIWRQLGDIGEQARILYERGYFEFKNGRYTEALPFFQEASGLAEKAGARRVAADIWNGIGAIYSNRGESGKALECYGRALGLARQEGNRGAEAATLTSLGLLLRRRGELQSALTDLRTALGINEQEGLLGDQGKVLAHLGGVYLDLGDMDKALDYYQQALKLFRSLQDRSQEGLALINLGQVYSKLRDWQTALDRFEEAWKILSVEKHPRRMAAAQNGIGVARLNLGRAEEAIQSLEVALSHRRDAGDRLGEASTLLELGNAWRIQGEAERATSIIQEALGIAEEIEASFVQAAALFSRAKIERDRGQLEAALASIERSIHILDLARSNLASDRLRSSFFASRRSYYDFYVDLLMRLGRWDKALEASERARARSLLDLLAEGRLDLNRGISPELKRQELDVNAHLTQMQASVMEELSKSKTDQDPEKIANLHARLDEIESKRQELEDKLRSEHPRYHGVRYSSPLTLAEIQKRLDRNTALLEYLLGEDGSYLFVVTQDGLAAYQLPPAAWITEKVEEIRLGIEQAGRRSFPMYTRAAHQLYEKLIAPARPALAGKGRLLISPDGSLHSVSFEVLLTEEDRNREYADLPYLLRDFSISYIPSASVLSWLTGSSPPSALAKREGTKRFLAFADPIYDANVAGEGGSPLTRGTDPKSSTLTVQERGLGPMPRLEGTAREIKAIAGLYSNSDVQLYEREQAKEENVKNNPLLETAQRIHFATHGVLNERQPELSGLRLTRTPTDDGLLQVHEIFDLNLQAEIVVLSACNTGRGKEVTGEGLVGVTRAFLYAGTPSVVVSLWQVADAQAPDLMFGFYEGMDRIGDKAEALRQAKLAMIRGRSYARPYYWAPFILVGKP